MSPVYILDYEHSHALLPGLARPPGPAQSHLARAPLPAPAQQTQGPNSRQRLFPIRLTFWAFLSQILNPGTSCREALRQVLALFCLGQQDPSDEQTSGYCQARQRLPLGRLQQILGQVAENARGRCPKTRLWHGREV